MKRTIYRIQWHGTAWRIAGVNGVPAALREHRTRDVAVAVGVLLCRLAQARGTLAQLVLHGQDGRIKWERTYGRDPARFKG